MKYYILKKEQNQEGNDFNIVKVKDEQVEIFCRQHDGNILVIADNLMEALLAFEKILRGKEEKMKNF